MILEPGAQVWAFTPRSAAHPNGLWKQITIGTSFDSGGTARIYTVNPHPYSRTLIKLYNTDVDFQARKAFYDRIYRMAQRQLILSQSMPIVAWPSAMVFATQRNSPDVLIGCTMPLIDNAVTLDCVAVPVETLAETIAGAGQDHQRLIGLNIAEGFELLHNNNVLFGDPNANNILINTKTFDVSFIDADSFSVTLTLPKGNADVFYPPPATAPGFRSPRTAILSNHSRIIADYAEADDNYALAIHLFKLLVSGFHPWGGITDAHEQLAIARRFPYAGPSRSLHTTCVQVQMFASLPQPIQSAFTLAFAENKPPTAKTWKGLIKAHWGHLRGQRDRLRTAPAPASP